MSDINLLHTPNAIFKKNRSLKVHIEWRICYINASPKCFNVYGTKVAIYIYYKGLKLSSDPVSFLHKCIYIINPALISKKSNSMVMMKYLSAEFLREKFLTLTFLIYSDNIWNGTSKTSVISQLNRRFVFNLTESLFYTKN